MRPFTLFALVGLAGCSSTPLDRQSSPRSDLPLRATVSAWATYSWEGEEFIYLWSADTPKSVFVVKASDAPREFIQKLNGVMPPRTGVVVEFSGIPRVQETATYVKAVTITGESILRQDGGFGDDSGQ